MSLSDFSEAGIASAVVPMLVTLQGPVTSASYDYSRMHYHAIFF